MTAIRIAEFVMRYRAVFLILILTGTLFFAFQIGKVTIDSRFEDLLPKDHPFIKVHNEFRERFGEAQLIAIGVVVNEGTIYKVETLEKIRRMTLEIDRAPGVNHYQVLSLAHNRVRDLRLDATGMLKPDVIMPEVPRTQEGLEELRAKVHQNKGTVYGRLVSLDDRAALITAGFIQGKIDYRKLFDFVRSMREREQDERHAIYVTGGPVLVGWLLSYAGEILAIFVVTTLVIVALLFFYFRRWHGVLIPMTAALVTAVWGLGFVGWMGYNLDPLILVIPLLITARAVSHTVQMAERFFEDYEEIGEKVRAATTAMGKLVVPGVIGVITDAAGLLVIAVTAIPQMKKLAFFGSFWVFSIVFSVLILHPLMIAYLPAPREQRHRTVGFVAATLQAIGRLVTGPFLRYAVVGAAFALLAILAVRVLPGLTIGEARPGSPLLKPDHEFNVAAGKINEFFGGADTLLIIADGDGTEGAVKRSEVVSALESFQRHMLRDPQSAQAISISTLLRQLNRFNHYADPKWAMIPTDRRVVSGLLYAFEQAGSVPGALDPFMTPDGSAASLTVFYADHRGDTIRGAIRHAEEFIEENPVDGIRFRLAGGVMGVLGAINDDVEKSHLWNIVLIFLIVFGFVALAYRSLVAGAIVVTSLGAASLISFGYMAWKGIGLNINTLPVQSVGVGVGVDYAIYVIDRIRQEYTWCGDFDRGIRKAITTTGMAVSFTATTLVGGIVLWLFSSLRFQSEMAVLLCILMVANMVGAIIFVPAMLAVLRPKFAVGREPEGIAPAAGKTQEELGKVQ